MIVIRVGTSLSVSNMEYSLVKTSERSPIRLADITASDRVSGLPLATPFNRMSLAFCTFGSFAPVWAGAVGAQRKQSPGRRRGNSFEVSVIRSSISLSQGKATNLLVCRKLAEVIVLALNIWICDGLRREARGDRLGRMSERMRRNFAWVLRFAGFRPTSGPGRALRIIPAVR